MIRLPLVVARAPCGQTLNRHFKRLEGISKRPWRPLTMLEDAHSKCRASLAKQNRKELVTQSRVLVNLSGDTVVVGTWMPLVPLHPAARGRRRTRSPCGQNRKSVAVAGRKCPLELLVYRRKGKQPCLLSA